MNYVKILICFIGILFISLVLFWVSPLSEFDTLTCYGLYDQNAQYIEGSGSCGISVGDCITLTQYSHSIRKKVIS